MPSARIFGVKPNFSDCCLADAVIACQCDLSDVSAINEVITPLIEKHRPITGLVNNAGVWPGAPLAKMDKET